MEHTESSHNLKGGVFMFKVCFSHSLTSFFLIIYLLKIFFWLNYILNMKVYTTKKAN